MCTIKESNEAISHTALTLLGNDTNPVCTFISLVNIEAIITFTEPSYWPIVFTQEKRFLHCPSGFRL